MRSELGSKAFKYLKYSNLGWASSLKLPCQLINGIDPRYRKGAEKTQAFCLSVTPTRYTLDITGHSHHLVSVAGCFIYCDCWWRGLYIFLLRLIHLNALAIGSDILR
jgi:hypothetical protein